MIRYEFLDETIREEDIHPGAVFEKERNLAYQFVNAVKTGECIQTCPVCRAHRDEILFEKWGLAYAICPNTWSIGLANIPDAVTIDKYFNDSKLSRLRASSEYQHQVTKKRRELWEHMVGWMEGRINRYLGNDKYSVIDWGAKYVGWIEFLSTASFIENLFVEDPLLPISRQEQPIQSVDIISLMDVLQRISNPGELLTRISKKLRPGGLLISVCRAGSGFDILTLRENSESIFPLDHIYLPSPSGLRQLLEQTGFEVIELTTPGLLDMRYIRNTMNKIPNDQFFQRYILNNMDDQFFERMQGFLQRNNLSSHLRCVARWR